MKKETSLLICPECKNTVDLTRFPQISPGMVIECNHCGITLSVKDIIDDKINTEIVDLGK